MMADRTRHYLKSRYREKVVEHIFVGELLRHLWANGLDGVEILTPEVDASGYDLVLTLGPIVRHVQLKCSIDGGKTEDQQINASLGLKPSGCIVWIVVDERLLSFRRFLWFGAEPGQPLPDLSHFTNAKHTRANAQGVKSFRANTKIVTRSKFTLLPDMASLVKALFGDGARSNPSLHPTPASGRG
jgi:hypothetical protein